MKIFAVIYALPLLALTAPALGQANQREDCSADVYFAIQQSDPDSIFTCYTIVVGNLHSSIGEETESIDRLKLPDLDANTRIEQLVGRTPGLQQFRRSDARSANPTSQGITARGLGGNASSRMLLFLDDVPQADPFGGWVSWPGYDALKLASIRVRKGGGLPSAGPGALAGVVELDSLQYRETAEVGLAYGSRNSAEARGHFGKAGYVSASASYARSDGFVPTASGQRGAADRQAPYEQGGLSFRAVAKLSNSTALQASMRGYFDNRNRGLDFSDSRNSGVDASLRVLKSDGDWQWSATGYLQIRDFSLEFGAVSADRNIVTPTLDQFATPSTGLGLRFEIRPPVGDKAELRLGGEWRRTIGETKERFTFVAGSPTRLRIAGGQTDSYGGFAEFNFRPVNDLTLSAGGRLDRWQIDNGFRREVNIGGTVRSDDRFADRGGTEWTGRAGFGWQINDALAWRASAYRGWRLPTLNELYRPFRVGADATAANERLVPESVKGGETGLVYDAGGNRFGAALFWNRLDDAIANVTLGQGAGVFPGVGFVAAGGTYRQRQNLDAIVSKGVELDAKFYLTDSLDVRFGYTYIDAEVRASGPASVLRGLRPAQVPRHFGNAALTFDDGAFSAEAGLRFIGQQFEDDANSRVLDDAFTADLSLGYALNEHINLELRGENLFNARVETAISSTGIIERANPRTIWLGVRWNFD
jgi:vitamin B12 transporter